jgi:hypothetical protein
LPCSSNAIKATPLFLFLSLGGERDGPFLSAVNRLAAIDKLNCPIHLIILKPVFRPEAQRRTIRWPKAWAAAKE